MNKLDLGHSGESLAASYLENKGYQILGKNIRTAYGEIDLLATQGKTLVFVEVKTRRSDRFGLPEEAITKVKFAHMVNAAQAYVQEKFEPDKNWRIDVIAIRLKEKLEPSEIVHFENVIL